MFVEQGKGVTSNDPHENDEFEPFDEVGPVTDSNIFSSTHTVFSEISTKMAFILDVSFIQIGRRVSEIFVPTT